MYKKATNKKQYFLDQQVLLTYNCPWHVPLLPGVCYVFGWLVLYISLFFISAKMGEVLIGCFIISTALLSKFVLKKLFAKTAVLGCVLVFCGFTLIQVIDVILIEKEKTQFIGGHKVWETIVGVVLLVISFFIISYALILQRKIFKIYSIHPLKVVFLQGGIGLLIMGILITTTTIFQFAQCPDVQMIQAKCIEYNNQFYFENVLSFLDEVKNNILLLLLNVGLLLGAMVAMPVGVLITKKMNPLARALASICGIIFVVGTCLILTFTLGENKNQYAILDKDLLVNLLKLLGGALMIVGSLVFHGVLKCKRSIKYKQKKSCITNESSFTSDLKQDEKGQSILKKQSALTTLLHPEQSNGKPSAFSMISDASQYIK